MYPSEAYVYALLDPRKDDQPFYIGKGRTDRAWEHLKETRENTGNRHKHSVICAIRDAGFEPIVSICAEGLTDEDALFIENEMIKFYGRVGYDEGGILTNVLVDQQLPTWLGHSDDTKERMKVTNRRERPPEVREKIALALRGRKLSDEHREKMRVPKNYPKGRQPMSEETRRKISETNKRKGIKPPVRTNGQEPGCAPVLVLCG